MSSLKLLVNLHSAFVWTEPASFGKSVYLEHVNRKLTSVTGKSNSIAIPALVPVPLAVTHKIYS